MTSLNERAAMYFGYIRERQLIADRRASGAPAPWTMDKVLATHHFCNNRREDDRVTKELRSVVLSANAMLPQLPATYTLARMLNSASSLAACLPGMLEVGGGGMGWMEPLKALRDRGEKIFHVAYVVSTCGRRMDKLDYVAEVVAKVDNIIIDTRTLDLAYRDLLSIDGLGTFMAGQIVADLKNDRYLVDAPDWFDWCSPGPGSMKGLEYIFGTRVGQSNFQHYFDIIRQALPEDIRDMKLHAQDLQNTLCEFSKYYRHTMGISGRSRSFTPRS